jgi:aminocarboxymuconate-semialdehyde decarboxylase
MAGEGARGGTGYSMKTDAWAHILSPSYAGRLEEQGGRGPGAFLLAQQPLHDIEVRLRLIEDYGDYRQILVPVPGVHAYIDPTLVGQTLVDLVRRNNDEMAQIVERYPDRFAGFVAATPITDADAATEEAVRSVRGLGALGVQLEEDAVNLPLHEHRYDPLFAAMDELGAGVWLHPYRLPATPGSPAETAPFLLWQVFGWTFDTTITISRLIFAGIYDRHPGLKLIAHHGGGLIPHFSGRFEIMPAFRKVDASGSLGEALDRLAKKPAEYFQMLYVDTAMFGGRHALRCVIDFFGTERVLFGTDAPFDTQGGSYFIPTTIEDVQSAVDSEAERAAIFNGNIERILGVAPTDPRPTNETEHS